MLANPLNEVPPLPCPRRAFKPKLLFFDGQIWEVRRDPRIDVTRLRATTGVVKDFQKRDFDVALPRKRHENVVDTGDSPFTVVVPSASARQSQREGAAGPPMRRDARRLPAASPRPQWRSDDRSTPSYGQRSTSRLSGARRRVRMCERQTGACRESACQDNEHSFGRSSRLPKTQGGPIHIAQSVDERPIAFASGEGWLYAVSHGVYLHTGGEPLLQEIGSEHSNLTPTKRNPTVLLLDALLNGASLREPDSRLNWEWVRAFRRTRCPVAEGSVVGGGTGARSYG